MRINVTRTLVFVSAGVACVLTLSGCATTDLSAATTESNAHPRHFSADASLLTPAVPQVYEFHGEVTTTADTAEAPLVHVASNVNCHLTIEDGVLVEAQINASLDGVNDLSFELTEPVVFEYSGEPKDQIVGTGILTIDESVYPETRVLFEPSDEGEHLMLGATIEVPDSLVTITGVTPEPLRFTLEAR